MLRWVVAAMAACVATAAIAAELPPPVSKELVDTNYQDGQPRSVVVGQTLVRVKGYTESKTYAWSVTTDADTFIKSGPFSGFVPAGTPVDHGIRRTARDKVTYDVYVFRKWPDGSWSAFNVDASDRVQKYVYRDMFGAWREHRKPTEFSPAAPGLKREVKETVTREPNNKNYEIVYLGQDGPSLKFEYREYTNDDLARAAFSQSLSYPKSAKTFRFRDLRFDQVKLTDDELTVKITGAP